MCTMGSGMFAHQWSAGSDWVGRPGEAGCSRRRSRWCHRRFAGDRVLERRRAAADLVGGVGRVVGCRRGGDRPPAWVSSVEAGLRRFRSAVAEDLGELAGPDPPELAGLAPGPVQHCHLEGGVGDHPVGGLPLLVGGVAQGRHREPYGVLERGAFDVPLLEVGRHDVGRAPHHRVTVFVGDLAVVGEPVDLVVLGGVSDLGDEELHLVGLLATAGEDRAERLGVGVGQPPAGDVAPVVGVAAHVGQPDARDAEGLELVVAADRGERDPVVDLGHLVQCLGRVLGDEQDAAGVLDHDHRTSSTDALAGEVGPVLHLLLGRDVERHAHVSSSPRRDRPLVRRVVASGRQPRGRRWRQPRRRGGVSRRRW